MMSMAVATMTVTVPAMAQNVAPPGATACSGCHGPGISDAVVPPLHGRPPGEIVGAMQDFRTGQRPATVMDRIAKGFTDEETRAIASWLSQQP
ncbi:cytochrome C [Microvirga sp. BT688]|jgi:sulfide dehydrogenase cytochrome subunit|nr:cytochrome C [Microvirga sp.]